MEKRIKNYEDYIITSEGKVISMKSGNRKILKPAPNHAGYLIVNFYNEGIQKGYSVHRLVAENLIPNNTPEKNQVNHINGIRNDNRIENLEWCTASENIRHSFDILKRKPTGEKHIICIDKDNNKLEFESLMKCAIYMKEKYSIKASERQIQKSISRVLIGYRKTYHKYTFKYK